MKGITEMQIEIIGENCGEIIARGDYYKGGVKEMTLKMYFEKGVLRDARAGAVYVLTTEWLNHMHEIGKLAWQVI